MLLHELITANRDEIIARTRAKAMSHSTHRPTDIELDKGIPLFLAELTQTLRRATAPGGNDPRGIELASTKHGSDLLRMGFSVSQVVHGYGDVCQVVTELALESAIAISTADFKLFNGCLDDAIACAVTEYERLREAGMSRQGAERLGTLAHELRNSLSTAMLASDTLRRGVVGPSSSTASLLNRSLTRLRDLIDRSLSEARLESGVVNLERVSIFDLVQEVGIAASAEATHRGVSFQIAPVSFTVEVEADRHLLIGAVENIVQNAFKFTPRNGHVCLTVTDTDGRIRIEIEDECGGLPAGKSQELFEAFAQYGSDRSGLGLGLWISHASLASMNGKVSVRDLPGKGCVFSVDLPKASPANAPSVPERA
jgi:signal transduction histidine kinase